MKNNIRLLTNEELKAFVDKYSFSIEGNFVWVEVKNFNRPTVHLISDSFSIICNNRKLIISPQAIELWKKYFRDRNLVEVQQAINTLILMYQQINVNDVKKILNKEI